MPKSEHSWLVVRAVDELDRICMLQEFIDMVVEQLDKPDSPQRAMKMELLLSAYQDTVHDHLVTLRGRLKDLHLALSPESSRTNLDYPPSGQQVK